MHNTPQTPNMFTDSGLMDGLVNVSDIAIAAEDDNKSVRSENEDLNQNYKNLGSPSGIRQQGSPSTTDESKRGSRLCAMKLFLNISKLQKGSRVMAVKDGLVKLLLQISGTMTAEENLLCIAIITNLTRDIDNVPELMMHRDSLFVALERGLESRNTEVQTCASMALQNLSCHKSFRVYFSKYDKNDSLLTKLAKVSVNGNNNNACSFDDSDTESEDGKKLKKKPSPDTSGVQISAIHTIKNLSIEPCNILPLTNTPGITASLMTIAMLKKEGGNEEGKENPDENIQYAAADALSSMSQWLNGIAVACAENNNLDLKDKPLTSLEPSTWNQWE